MVQRAIHNTRLTPLYLPRAETNTVYYIYIIYIFFLQAVPHSHRRMEPDFCITYRHVLPCAVLCCVPQVKYKNVMKQYSLGPNGGILTSCNLFATRFDQARLGLPPHPLPGG